MLNVLWIEVLNLSLSNLIDIKIELRNAININIYERRCIIKYSTQRLLVLKNPLLWHQVMEKFPLTSLTIIRFPFSAKHLISHWYHVVQLHLPLFGEGTLNEPQRRERALNILLGISTESFHAFECQSFLILKVTFCKLNTQLCNVILFFW